MIVAIVPAAGKSERMGQPKLLLPLGPRRVIEHVLVALADSRVDRIIVVVQPGANELCSLARQHRKVEVVQLAEPTPDMRSSILHAIDHAEKLSPRQLPEAFLMALADQPAVSTRVVDDLIARFRSSHRSIFVPSLRGRRGHPVLFAWRLVPAIRAIPPDRGLNYLLEKSPEEIEELRVDDSSLLEDLDSPADYERLLERDVKPDSH